MRKHLVLTASGKDRPGIIEQFTKTLLHFDGNVEASRMARLGGEFAMILLISGENPVEDLIPEMESKSGMTITARNTTAKHPGGEGLPFIVYGYAMDHPGIVHALAHEVASFGAKIADSLGGSQVSVVYTQKSHRRGDSQVGRGIDVSQFDLEPAPAVRATLAAVA